uniref:Uncharacterized protein n=1 Tax=Myoviridae sp. ctDzM5 TaxID=2825058 RepID=A0A8S5V8F4_9CAUD|nr:MAG TPA: hypothetical protein [Myoviridae sp. ctDzM5]
MSKNLCIACLVMSIFCIVMSLCPGDERHKKVSAFLGWLNVALWICIYIRDMF